MADFLTTYQAFIALGVLAVMFVGFVTEFLPASAIAVCGAVSFLVLGYIGFDELLTVFSNDAPVTIAAMFVISGALVRTGTLAAATSWLVQHGQSRPRLVIVAVMFGALAASAFVNNTPVVLVLIPIVARLAQSVGMSSTRLLIPLSYAAILGGTCTLIGTSTNLLVAGIAQNAGLESFTIFEITPVGVVVALAGSLMLLLLGPILLPHRHTASDMLEDVDDEPFLTEAKVLPESAHVGKKAGALNFLKPDGVTLLAVKRGTATQRRDLDDFEIAAGDRLVLSARESEILAMEEREGLAVGQSAAARGEEERIVAKAFVAPSRKGMRQRLAEQSDIRRSGIRVLGVSRHRHSPGPDLDAVMLRPADRLLVEGPVEAVARLGDDHDLINIAETRARPFRRSKAPIALGALALVVVLAALDVMPIGALAMMGIAAILLTRCIDAQEAWASINWDLLILIFAMLAIGVGLDKTGAIELIVRGAVPILEYAPYIVVLVGLYALTSFLTEIVTNNAVAIVLTPIAINLAEAMQLDPRPLVVAIMFGASASFATPIGYQTNTLVYGAADYRFSDFLKIGIPMNIIVGIASCAAIAFFMPA